MVVTALVLAAALAAPPGNIRPTPVIPVERAGLVAPLPWNECGTEPPDWREPRPLVVLSDDQELSGHMSIPAMAGTAFALYADGTVFAREHLRNRIGVRRGRLSPAERDRLLASLELRDLLRLPERLHVPSRFPPGTIICDGGPEELSLNVWVDGCRRTIAVTNLSTFTLDWVLTGAATGSGVAEERAHARAALASLPLPLASALRTLIRYRPVQSRSACVNETCFHRARTLPNQVAWRSE